MARGNWGILELKPAPTLKEFLDRDFLPFTRARFAGKAKSREYYEYGVARLVAAGLSDVRIDQLTSQHALQFAARYSDLSASTINCGLRTLRRALNLTFGWGKLGQHDSHSALQRENGNATAFSAMRKSSCISTIAANLGRTLQRSSLALECGQEKLTGCAGNLCYSVAPAASFRSQRVIQKQRDAFYR